VSQNSGYKWATLIIIVAGASGMARLSPMLVDRARVHQLAEELYITPDVAANIRDGADGG
jgi:hypothetical protein